jgi:flavin reductase
MQGAESEMVLSEPERLSPLEARASYREGMAALANSVHIVTTTLGGTRVGFAATAVCSVSDEPPTLLVCLNRESSVYAAFKTATTLCVNTLSASHVEVARRFGGQTSQECRFATGNWTSLNTRSPVLADAAVVFDCRVVSRTTINTHDIFICEVVAIFRSLSPSALIYFNRAYREIG